MRGLSRAKSSGFTLLEIIVVMTMFSLLVGVCLFMGMESFKGTIYRSEEATIVSLLQKARSRSMNNMQQTAWGVCYVAPNYVIFRGRTCSVAAVDTFAANAGVAAASNFAATFPTVSFTQLSGTTTATTLTVTQDSKSSTITINNEGAIIW